jgi:hypothetical protein
MRYLSGLKRFQDRLVLPNGIDGQRCRQKYECFANDERDMALKYLDFRSSKQLKKQSEALNHKAEGNQRDTGSVPCQQRPFGCEEYTWVTQFRHQITPG